MNNKVKNILTFGIGFFSGMYAMCYAVEYLCEKGRVYVHMKDGHGNRREFGDRKIIQPTSGQYHWNSDSEEEEETSE